MNSLNYFHNFFKLDTFCYCHSFFFFQVIFYPIMAEYQCTIHFPLVLMGYKCSLQGPALSLFHCLFFSTATFFAFPWSFCYCFLITLFYSNYYYIFITLSLKFCCWHISSCYNLCTFWSLDHIYWNLPIEELELYWRTQPQNTISSQGNPLTSSPTLQLQSFWIWQECITLRDFHITDSQLNSMTQILFWQNWYSNIVTIILTSFIGEICWRFLLFHFLHLETWSCFLTVCRSWYLLSFIMPVFSYRCIYSLFLL